MAGIAHPRIWGDRMNSRLAEEGPPRNGNARGQAGVGTARTSNYKPDFTRPQAIAQGVPRWQVRTVKASGAEIVFSEYSTLLEATLISRRLHELGGDSHIVEVRP
jgi:hypothetical protein